MENEELKILFEGTYGKVRQAFADYDMDTARSLLDVPPETPEPTREQATAMAQFMPDIANARFIEIRTEGDWGGYYAETSTEQEGCEVSVIRFLREEAGWRLAPAPHTMSSYGSDEVKPGEGRVLMEREEILALIPEGGSPE